MEEYEYGPKASQKHSHKIICNGLNFLHACRNTPVPSALARNTCRILWQPSLCLGNLALGTLFTFPFCPSQHQPTHLLFSTSSSASLLIVQKPSQQPRGVSKDLSQVIRLLPLSLAGLLISSQVTCLICFTDYCLLIALQSAQVQRIILDSSCQLCMFLIVGCFFSSANLFCVTTHSKENQDAQSPFFFLGNSHHFFLGIHVNCIHAFYSFVTKFTFLLIHHDTFPQNYFFYFWYHNKII